MDKKWIYIPELLYFQEGPGVRKHQYTTEGVKLLNVANLVDGKVDLSTSDRYISDEEANGKYNHFLADEGDLIIASSGIKVDYFDKKMGFVKKEHLPLCMNTSTIRFKSLDDKKLNINYFMYFLKSSAFKHQLYKEITGSAQLNFGPTHLSKMKFPLIDINEQVYIAEVLNKIETVVEHKRHQLDEYDYLIKSRFVEMFGDPQSNPFEWIKSPMGDYLTLLTDFSANGSYKYLDSNVVMYDDPNYALMVRTTDLEKQNFEVDVKYVDENSYNILSKSKIFGNEIIMNKIGSAGKVYLMPCLNRPVTLGRNAFMFRYNDLIDPLFVYFLLTSEYVTNEIMQHVRGAVTKTITKDAVRSVKLIVPPIDLQKQFSHFVQHVDKLRVEVQKSLDETQLLFDSLMQKYFD